MKPNELERTNLWNEAVTLRGAALDFAAEHPEDSCDPDDRRGMNRNLALLRAAVVYARRLSIEQASTSAACARTIRENSILRCEHGTAGCWGKGDAHACEAQLVGDPLEIIDWERVEKTVERGVATALASVGDLRTRLRDAEREAFEAGEHVASLLRGAELAKKAKARLEDALRRVVAEAASSSANLSAIRDYAQAALRVGPYAKRKAAKR